MSKAVAILGSSFLLPSASIAEFGQDLLDGKNLVSNVAPDRWSLVSFSHPQKNHPGTAYTANAGSVGDVSQFDASFFGISPREAAQMDPQQRVLLELSWQALEDAGIKPSSLRGTACGVYIGIASADYSYRLAEDLASIDSAVATGNTASISANRISYFFDLRGPSMAIDTACSSSLVAFHQACQAIRSGEITHALTGGISLHLHPYGFIIFSKASMLSPNGNCNVFDENGDGYVRSEGGGMFLLKDYDLAVADGDRILAVVAHSAVNTDGKKSGLTIPKPEAQTELLVSSYAAAGISPDEISYIEAHGTGTAVGDPIETLALGLSLGQRREANQPLPIGSVKSNLGHLEAASGVAGLVKALFVVEHRKIPPTIGVNTLNPRIDFKGLNLDVVTSVRELPEDKPVVVGVNSFGFGGANAHVILRSHDPAKNSSPVLSRHNANNVFAQSGSVPNSLTPFLISAATPQALQAACTSISRALTDSVLKEKADPEFFYDAAYQLAYRREAFEHRAVVFAKSNAEFVSAQLAAYAQDSDNSAVVAGLTLTPTLLGHGSEALAQGPAFFYSGNGSQWLGMGRALLSDPVFNEALREIDQTLVGLAGFSIAQQLQGCLPELSYDNTEIAQPALFAVQVGVTRMLAAMGVTPQAVAGHSVGEVAAAWCAGILDLSAAVEVIYHRSRLQQRTKGRGNMTAVALPVHTAMAWLSEEQLSAEVFIAGVNSFRGITLAGTDQHLNAFESRLTQERVGFKRLDLDYAFHSPAMNGIETEIEHALGNLKPRAGMIPFYSSVTGGLLSGTELIAEYWWKNIRQPVLFELATNALLSTGCQVLIEIGPHPVLRAYLNDCLSQHAGAADAADHARAVLPSLSRQQDGIEQVQAMVARTWISGAKVDLSVFFPVVGKHVTLPFYPWQKERHWHSVSSESPNTLHRVIEHPLLGYRLPQHDLLWENKLDPYRQPFLADHVVGEAMVFPGTGYVELALAAAQAWHAEGVKQLEDLEILSPITFNSSHGKMLRVGIDAADGRIKIQSRDLLSAEGWTLNARARIIVDARFPEAETNHGLGSASLEQLSLRIPDFNGASHLSLTRQVGLHYGAAFDAIRHGWIASTSVDNISGESATPNDYVTALFDIPESISASLDKFHIHPALLDCSFQLIIQMLRDKVDLSEGIAFVPTQIGRISWQSGLGEPHRVQARLLRKLTHSLLAEFTLFDLAGHAIVRIEGARFRRVRLQKASVERRAIQNIHTRYIPMPLQPGMHASRVRYQAMLDAGNDIARRSVVDRNYRNFVDELDPLLDALCSAYAFEALSQLGLSDNPATSARVIEALLEKSPQTSALLQHLISLCIEDGKIIEVAEGIKLYRSDTDETDHSPMDRHDALSIWSTLIADYPDYFAVVHMVGKVGQHLSQILSGERSLAQVLDKTSHISIVMDKVVGDAFKARMVRAIREIFKQAAEQLSPSERLSILEVAAFKPSIACEIGLLERPDNCDVVFACPDMAGLETMSQLVEAFPTLQFDSFDAGILISSVSESAYRPWKDYRVDLAVVWLEFETAVLNNRAIDYAIKHLKPGGTLLVEGLHRTRWLDFTFGGQESWWQDQSDHKKLSMQRDRATWESRLASMGLDNVRHMDATHESTSGSYMLLSHMPLSTVVRSSVDDSPRSWLLIDDDTDVRRVLRDGICAGLQKCGDIVEVCRLSHLHQESEQLAEQLRSMRADFGELDGIIHINGMGGRYHATHSASGVNRCMSAAHLIKACETTHTTAPIWFITAGVHADEVAQSRSKNLADLSSITNDVMLSGFIRTLANEINTNRVQCIDLSAKQLDQGIVDDLIDELTLGSAETELVLTQDNGRFVPRLQLGHQAYAEHGTKHLIDSRPLANQENQANQTIQLNFSQPGQLRNLQWQAVIPRMLADDEVELSVEATGLNFRDVMYALGLLSDEAIENGFAGATLGLECAGKITRMGKHVTQFATGERVVGFGPACFANRVITKATAISHIPRALSSEAAASIPSTFLTSYYALVHLGRLEAGEKILIHGAAGGVGLAAIQIARWCGAEIFATAGSEEKRELLRMMGVPHVLDSRSLSFAEDILSITQGLGIDMVLNSLAGEAINRNLSILKPFGRFLELGKRDFYENTRLGLRPFRNNITYFGIDADQLMNEKPELTAKLFGEVMGLFEKGILHALPFTRFEARDVVEAFRYMQQSQQIGKVVVTYRNGIPAAEVVHSKAINLKAHARLVLDREASYVVSGGLGGFGLRSAQWLADMGARHLILLGRRGPDTEEARTGILSLEKMGVKVSAFACDITDEKALAETINPWLSQIKGIVHAAAVIEDSLIENLSAEQFERVLRPKVTGALNLHRLTCARPLDFFVMFSSATTLFGNPGQAAYVAANAGLEAIATMRQAKGLPATCMLWGAIEDAGYLARNKQIKDALQQRMGGQALSCAEAFDQLEQAILNGYNNEAVLELNFSALSKFLSSSQSPRFSELARLGSRSGQEEKKIEDIPRLLNELDQIALNLVLMDMVKSELSQILRIAPEKIDTGKSIYDMGLDSLMGMELVVALEARFGVRLSVMTISENPSIEKLTQRLIALLRSQSKQPVHQQTTSADVARDAHVAQVTELANLHGSESSPEEIAALAQTLDAQATHQKGKFLQ